MSLSPHGVVGRPETKSFTQLVGLAFTPTVTAKGSWTPGCWAELWRWAGLSLILALMRLASNFLSLLLHLQGGSQDHAKDPHPMGDGPGLALQTLGSPGSLELI